MSVGKQRFQIIRNRDWRQLAGEPWFFRWMVVQGTCDRWCLTLTESTDAWMFLMTCYN